MARNITRKAFITSKEILRSAAGLDDIKSMVIDSTKVTVVASGDAAGRYLLEDGTVMVKVQGDAKGRIMPLHMNAAGGSGDSGAYVAADVVGILGTPIEFPIGAGVAAGLATDKEVAILHHGCDFNASKLVGYTGNEAVVKAALPTCLFR